MAAFILIALIAIPLVEIAVFVEVGGRIGAWNTVLLVVATAIGGIWLLRRQGLRTLRRAQESFDSHVLPVAELFDALCLLGAGGLLLIPGFVTDAVALLLLVPPLRRLLRHWLWLALARSPRTRVWVNGEEVARPDRPRGGPGMIEGEFREVEHDDDRDRKLPR